MTLKQLADLISEKKYSKIPVHARPKVVFSDKTSNDFTKAVVAYLLFNGHYARRLSSEGRYRPGEEVTDVIGHRKQMKGMWLPGMNTGMSDVFAVIKPTGRFLGIEVKINKDRQSDDQKEFQENVISAGGLYFIVKNWDDFLFAINPYIK
jgi:hypothetical protein